MQRPVSECGCPDCGSSLIDWPAPASDPVQVPRELESGWPKQECPVTGAVTWVEPEDMGVAAPSSGDVVQVPRELPPFAQQVISKLRRVHDCFTDAQGADVEKHWLDLLTLLGLLNRVQRSPALWEISQQGEDLLNGGRV